MKTLVFHSAFLALIGLVLSPLAVAYASPSPADSMHFCQLIDYEQWRRDHPRPAGKRLALNVGEPRTVRMIYFLPNDRPFRQEVVDSMKAVIRQVQTFYAEQMQAHGYGDKTFRFETDAQGEPLVHRVDGRHPDSHYVNTYGGAMIDELEKVFDFYANIYNIILDGGYRGAGGELGKIGGSAWLSSGYIGNTAHGSYAGATAHEIGHAFGLHHDWRDDAYIMSYGPRPDRLSACAAEFLSMHPYFNPEIPTKEGPPPTIELISPRTYPAGSGSVPIQLKVADSQGLHQVILVASAEPGGITVRACRGLSGERDAVVEFEYDGDIPSAYGSSSVSSLSDLVAHPLVFQVVDLEGNMAWTNFMLVEVSPHLIATLEGHTEGVASVAFSPDGTLLASGSWNDTVKLWDVSTERQIATLPSTEPSLVAFSPDGKTLAVGTWDNTVELWDVATQERIATLGHRAVVFYTVSFSPDGKTLAVGTWDNTVELWDVATQERIATLGHEAVVNAVSFSPDGTLLASGSRDNTVKLWDVATRERIATLGHGAEVDAVSFSPDGTLLASGSGDGTVKLWDVATRDQIAILKHHTNGWYNGGATSASFSASDGALLATKGGSGTVILWDVLTREKIVTFWHTYEIASMSFSPDGTTLAAGGVDGTILLWDISGRTGTRPFALKIISGDGQEGSASTQLAEPFVVSVVDQDGSPLAGAVTFSVTAGGGLLSSTTDANPCTIESSTSSTTATTDANGHAATRLTLGSDPGTNTVAATVEGLETVTFTSTAAEQAMPHSLTKVCGDDQEGTAGEQLAESFVVSVLDEDSAAMVGVVVSFSVTAGGGTLSAATATTDANGRADTRLTLGSESGTNTVSATVEGLESVTFTATGQESPFASLFDLFQSGKLVALPDSPQLAQNAPNPFNSQTVLSYFLHAPGPAHVEVFALNGQRVAVLHQGPQQAGYHRLRWNGRDDAGRPVASGMYLYRLVTDEVVLTRKLILLR